MFFTLNCNSTLQFTDVSTTRSRCGWGSCEEEGLQTQQVGEPLGAPRVAQPPKPAQAPRDQRSAGGRHHDVLEPLAGAAVHGLPLVLGHMAPGAPEGWRCN